MAEILRPRLHLDDARRGSSATHTMRAQAAIRERILSGRLQPGERLAEVGMAEDLAISRTPVREAMGRLAEEGLLERMTSGGYRVRAFTYADVADAILLRGVLEGTAARLAAERGADPSDLRDIVEALEPLFAAEEFDFATYGDLNAAFHEALWAASGSEVLRRETARIASLPFASPSAFTPGGNDIESFQTMLRTAQDQHRMIVEAIADREGSRAEALAREHARIARRTLGIFVKQPAAQGQQLVAQLRKR